MGDDYTKLEVTVGGFVAIGLAALAFVSLSLGGLDLVSPDRYQLQARFASVGDLSEGASVQIAGVRVGVVEAIVLDDYVASVTLAIDRDVKIPADSIASIRTAGLLGDAFVSLLPGGADQSLEPGQMIPDTEPAIDLVELIGKYAFGDTTGAARFHDSTDLEQPSFEMPLRGEGDTQ